MVKTIRMRQQQQKNTKIFTMNLDIYVPFMLIGNKTSEFRVVTCNHSIVIIEIAYMNKGMFISVVFFRSFIWEMIYWSAY